MFSGLMARIRRAASSAMGSVLGRLAVGVLFVIAAAFAVAAITLALIDAFGTQAAYWILAVGFAVIGGLVALLLSAKEDEQKAEEQAQSEISSSSMASSFFTPENAFAAASTLAPMLMRPSTAGSALGIVRFSIRNLPLLIMAALILVLVFPFDRMRPIRPASEEPTVPPAAV